VSVRITGYEPAHGVGRTKRQAEQAAATAVLVRENVWKDGGGI
jgi:ribonuclease III